MPVSIDLVVHIGSATYSIQFECPEGLPNSQAASRAIPIGQG